MAKPTPAIPRTMRIIPDTVGQGGDIRRKINSGEMKKARPHPSEKFANRSEAVSARTPFRKKKSGMRANRKKAKS
jgi:hypothetical protein